MHDRKPDNPSDKPKTTEKVKTNRIIKGAATAVLLLATGYKINAEEPAQDNGEKILGLNVEARLDYQYVENQGKSNQSQTGFMGKYIALKAQGTLAKGLSYTWRQRFSRTPKDNTFWDQTDILDLKYQYDKIDIGAGKQVVMIGGYEYDRAPIDLICPNIFVSNVACYQFGVSAGYQITPNDHIGFQISQSLFATAADRNLYSYNLMWSSSRKLSDTFKIETLWSVNEMEYQKGKYCNYVALGNKLTVNDNITVLLDLMTRTYPDNRIFKNNTFMLEGSWDIHPKWRITGKVSYDCNLGVNKTTNTEVTRGTQLTIFGGFAEWFPLHTKTNLLRMHAGCFYSTGKNPGTADLMHKNTLYMTAGLTWHMNLLNIKRH